MEESYKVLKSSTSSKPIGKLYRLRTTHGIKMEIGQLRVWKDAYGAPSLEPTSLQILTYIRFNRLTKNVRIIYGSVPQWAPIPRFTDAKGHYDTVTDILQAINVTLNGNDTDKKYYSSEMSKIEAYKSYAGDVLGFAYQAVFWYNDINYYNVTKPYYYSLVSFPFKYFYVKDLIEHHFHQLRWLQDKDLQQELIHIKMAKAEQCLIDISKILEDKPYIMGDHPSSLDALVYSLLAPVYYAPLEKCDFQAKLKAYLNLSKYIRRISKVYFPEIKYKPAAQLKDDEYERAPWWQLTLAGLSAFVIMCWFAHSKGLVRIVI